MAKRASNELTTYVNNADAYVGRAVVSELTSFCEAQGVALTLKGTALNAPGQGSEAGAARPSDPSVANSITVLPRDEEFMANVVGSDLIVYDLFCADLPELERILQKVKLVSHNCIFVLVSSVLTWAGTKCELEELPSEKKVAITEEEGEPPAPAEEREEGAEEAAPPAPPEPVTTKFAPKTLSASDFQKRVCPDSEILRQWQRIETLVTSLNIRANLRGIVVTTGLLYGCGELPQYQQSSWVMPSLSFLLKNAWQQKVEAFCVKDTSEKTESGDISIKENFLPLVHVRDAAKLALEAAFFPEEEQTSFDFKKAPAIIRPKASSKSVYVAVDESQLSLKEIMSIVATEFCGSARSSKSEGSTTFLDSEGVRKALYDYEGGVLYAGGEEQEDGTVTPLPGTVELLRAQTEKDFDDLMSAKREIALVESGTATLCSSVCPLLEEINLRLTACSIWGRISEHSCKEFGKGIRTIGQEYCQEVNLKPIRAMFAGPPGSYSPMMDATSKEFAVPILTFDGMHLALAEWCKAIEAPEESEDPVVVFLRDRLDFETGAWKVNEESGEAVVTLDEKRSIYKKMLQVRLSTSEARYRGFLLDGFPTNLDDAKSLFATFVPAVEAVVDEEAGGSDAEAVEETPSEPAYFELREYFPDLFVITNASEGNSKEGYTSAEAWADANTRFKTQFLAPYETLAEQKKAMDAYEAQVESIREPKKKELVDAKVAELKEAAKAAAAAEAEAAGEEPSSRPQSPEISYNPDEDEELQAALAEYMAEQLPDGPPVFDPIEYPASEFFTPGNKVLQQSNSLVVLSGGAGDGETDEAAPPAKLPSTSSTREITSTQLQKLCAKLELDHLFADGSADAARMSQLMCHEFCIAFEAAHSGDKIFNFFPTEEELRLAEEKRKAEEAARLAAEEEARRQAIFEKEEKETKAVNANENTRLARIERETNTELQNLSVPLKEYMQKHVVPHVAQGLLEMAKVMPEDPVEFLAEHLFKVGTEIPPLPQ
ncbi:unnamed protein product [Amoebophrya sp. A25]|nr:unnamed protein product [Amoebophrya sp. A25]|eukprot:GSA25T00019429001.1